MTVADLIARLSQYPADMPVLFSYDGAFIVAEDPEFTVESANELDGTKYFDYVVEVPTLFIDIN